MNEYVLAIDIGSNTIKCLFAKKAQLSIREIFTNTANFRICGKNGLVDNAKELIVQAICDFIELAKKESESFDIIACATSALRGAQNADEICRYIYDKCGVKINIISGQTEAMLSMSGALSDSALPKFDKCVFFDLGGGSMECGYCENGKPEKAVSIPIGAVRLTKKFIKNPQMPVSAETILKINDYCLAQLKAANFKSHNRCVIATGGAVAAARLMQKTPNGSPLELGQLKFALKKIAASSAKERSEKYGIEPARSDIIAAAFTCILAALEYFDADKIYYTRKSLRWGMCMEHFRGFF